jgi:hypothetical protein
VAGTSAIFEVCHPDPAPSRLHDSADPVNAESPAENRAPEARPNAEGKPSSLTAEHAPDLNASAITDATLASAEVFSVPGTGWAMHWADDHESIALGVYDRDKRPADGRKALCLVALDDTQMVQDGRQRQGRPARASRVSQRCPGRLGATGDRPPGPRPSSLGRWLPAPIATGSSGSTP